MGMLDAFTTVIAIPFVVSLVAPAESVSEQAQKKGAKNIAVNKRFIVNLFSSSSGTIENLIDKRCRRFVMALN